MFEDIFGDFDRQVERITNIDDGAGQVQAVDDVWKTDVWSTADEVNPDYVWGRVDPDYVWRS